MRISCCPSRSLRRDPLAACSTEAATKRDTDLAHYPTFHAAKGGVYFGINSQTLLAESAGIPISKAVSLASSVPALLERQVERVGGFLVVVKVLGRYGGIGVMLAEIDSIASCAGGFRHSAGS